jgi:hypothetical protein
LSNTPFDKKTFIDVKESHVAKVTITGLQVGSKIWLRHRASSRNASRDWRPLIEYLVTK